MALSQSVETSLKEAESSLRNALSYAARQERPMVCNAISKMIVDIDHIMSVDGLLDKLEQRMEGDKGTWGPFGS